VTGETCTQATTALQKLTLKPSCTSQHSAKVPQGQAFATSPGPPGTPIAQGTAITIFISSGPGLVLVPNVVGETAGPAKRALTNAGFVPSVKQQVICTNTGQNNIVQSQVPAGGSAPRGSTVTIVVDKFKPNDPSCTGGPGST
jgi:beta-lactam-binding protein with PASTA domain